MTESELVKWLKFSEKLDQEFPKSSLYGNANNVNMFKSKVLTQAKEWGYSKNHKVPKSIWKTLQDHKYFRVARILDLEGLVNFETNSEPIVWRYSGKQIHLKTEKSDKKSIFDY